MEYLLSRFRNLAVLLLVLFAQLILLAYQVKTNQDVRLVRIWAVTAVTPLARILEGLRTNTVRLADTYLLLVNTQEENGRLEAELGQAKLENQFLRSQLETADRAQALLAFKARIPSQTIAARIIGTGAGANSKVVFVDRGSTDGVRTGMAVINPGGVVGRVLAAYPTASQVLLITDPSFAAGVISEKHRVQGTLKGLGTATCSVDYLQNEQPVDVGEWFYTSGDDRVFPRGLRAGRVTAAQPGKTFKQVFVAPSGLEGGLDEILIVLEGVHQPIPQTEPATTGVPLLAPPPADEAAPEQASETHPAAGLNTEADRLRERYKRIGEAQGHVFGEGVPGSKPPDFNRKPGEAGAPATVPAPARSAVPETGKPAPPKPATEEPPGRQAPDAP